MTKLTEKEWLAVKTIMRISNGFDTENMDHGIEQMIGDNYTWFKGEELMTELNWSRESVGGVMSSLISKGIVGQDDGCSKFKAPCFLEPEEIKEYWNNK